MARGKQDPDVKEPKTTTPRIVHVEEEEEKKKPIKAFVTFVKPAEEENRKSIKTLVTHLGPEDAPTRSARIKRDRLHQALRELEEWRQKYKNIEEFAEISRAIDKFRESRRREPGDSRWP